MEITQPLKVAIFGSGMGSNAKKIIEYFNKGPEITIIAKISIIVCNKADAGIVEIAEFFNTPYLIVNKEKFYSGQYNDEIKKSADFIVLAGFLLKIPSSLIQLFPNRIINIHPALLPLYGGKGMYGNKVHEAVLKNNDLQSGISIHYVDENYDTGNLIFQAKCNVEENDSALTLAKKIHELEHAHFPEIILQELIKLKKQLNK